MFIHSAGITYQGQVKQQGAYLTLRPGMPLSQWVNCFWQLDVPAGDFIYRVVPDNCVDWIFDLSGKEESFVVSPFVSPIEFSITGPASYFGIRFNVLGCQGLTGIPVGEWADKSNSIDAKQLFRPLISEPVLGMLSPAGQFDQRCERILEILPPLLQGARIDPRLVRFIRYNYEGIARGDSSRLNSEGFGISCRQLRRLSQLHLGLSPKSFLKVTRFQSMLHVLYAKTHQRHGWAQHYYDQSHFIREFKALSGTTPTRFLNMSVLYNKS